MRARCCRCFWGFSIFVERSMVKTDPLLHPPIPLSWCPSSSPRENAPKRKDHLCSVRKDDKGRSETMIIRLLCDDRETVLCFLQQGKDLFCRRQRWFERELKLIRKKGPLMFFNRSSEWILLTLVYATSSCVCSGFLMKNEAALVRFFPEKRERVKWR